MEDLVYTKRVILREMTQDAFVALANPTRRHIVVLLREQPRSVGEIVAGVKALQPDVSRHLRVLHDAGFVAVEADGQRRIYSLRVQPFQQLDAWLGDYRGMWEERLDRLAELVEPGE